MSIGLIEPRYEVLDLPGTPCTALAPNCPNRVKRYSASLIVSGIVVILAVGNYSIEAQCCLYTIRYDSGDVHWRYRRQWGHRCGGRQRPVAGRLVRRGSSQRADAGGCKFSLSRSTHLFAVPSLLRKQHCSCNHRKAGCFSTMQPLATSAERVNISVF